MNKNLIVLLLILICVGCVNKFEPYDLEGDLFTEGGVLPLVHAELEAGDVFSIVFDGSSLVQAVGENGELVLTMRDTITTVKLADLVQTSAISESASVPFGYFNYNREYSTTLKLPFTSSQMEISKVNLSYTLNLKATDFLEPIKFTVNIPGINSEKGGKEVETILNGNQEIALKFEGDELTLTDDVIEFNAIISPDRKTGVYQNYTGTFFIDVSDVKINSITGKVKSISEAFDNSFEIGLGDIESLTENTPELSFIFSNTLPVQGVFDIELYGQNKEGKELELSHPEFVFSQAGETVSESVITLDENNSNVADFIAILPDKVNYFGSLDIEATSNSNEITINDEDYLMIEYLLEFPSEFEFSTSIESDYLTVSESDIIDELTSATVALTVANEFPLQSTLIIYMYDDAGNELDTIVFPGIEPAPLNDEGIVTSVNEQNIDKELSAEELENLKQSKQFLVKVEMDTNDKKVIIKESYRFELKLALKAKR